MRRKVIGTGHSANFTDKQIRTIRDCRYRGWKVSRLADKYKVAGSTISRICSYRNYENVY